MWWRKPGKDFVLKKTSWGIGALGGLDGGVRLGWTEKWKVEFSGQKNLCAHISNWEHFGAVLVLFCMCKWWVTWVDWLRVVITACLAALLFASCLFLISKKIFWFGLTSSFQTLLAVTVDWASVPWVTELMGSLLSFYQTLCSSVVCWHRAFYLFFTMTIILVKTQQAPCQALSQLFSMGSNITCKGKKHWFFGKWKKKFFLCISTQYQNSHLRYLWY